MSKSSDLSANEPKSAAEIVKTSTDKLVQHASDTVETITESLSETKLIATDAGSNESSMEAESSAGASLSGHSAQSRDGPNGESGVAGWADTLAERIDGQLGSSSRDLVWDTGAGGHGVAVTGLGAGTGAGSAGNYTGGQTLVGSNSASAPFRSPGEVSESSQKGFPGDAQSVSLQSITDFLEADRRDSFEIRRGDAEFVQETDYGANKTLEISAFSSTGSQTVAGEKKRPDTLATRRWKKAYHFVKKQNAMKKKILSSPIGTGATLDGHALGFLSINSGTRKTLFRYLYNEKAEYLLFGIIVSHLFVLILKAEYKWVTNFHPTEKALNIADIALTAVYTGQESGYHTIFGGRGSVGATKRVECICRIVTLGFWRGPHAYLRNSYNKVDFVIVIDSWVHIIRTLVLEGDDFLRIGVLRVFRALLVLRGFSFVGNVLAILDAIARTLPPLKYMAVIIVMFLACYSSLGEGYFRFTLRWRCVRGSDGELTYPELFCTPDLKSHGVHRSSCPINQGLLCQMGNDPNYGITNFENVGAIYLILIQTVSFEGWSLIMMETRKTMNSAGADAYFIILVIFGGYFLVNVLVAAVSGVFLRVRQEHQMARICMHKKKTKESLVLVTRRALYHESPFGVLLLLLRKYRRDKEFSFANAIMMANLLKEVITGDENLSWRERLKQRTAKLSRQLTRSFSRETSRMRSRISRAADGRDSSSSMRSISSFGFTGFEDSGGIPPSDPTYRLSFSRSLSNGARYGRSLSRSLSLTTEAWAKKLSSICRIIVHSKVFKYGVLFTISFNTAFLCTLSPKSARRRVVAVYPCFKCWSVLTTQKVMVGLFSLELVVRFLAVGLSGFVDEGINVLDLTVVIFSSSAVISTYKIPNILPVRMLRWFYVKRSRTKKEEEGSPILVSILRSFPAVLSVFFFFFLNILIISIFSAELWGGNMHFNTVDFPRANYDTLPQAMLLWFSVTTGESWVNQMWNVFRPGMKNRWIAPVFFVVFYISTAIFTINLIIAAILEETELTDYQKKLIQKRDHVKWLQVKHTRRFSSTRSADWLLNIFEGFKGVKRRMSSMKTSSLSVSQSLSQVAEEQKTSRIVLPTGSSFQEAETSKRSTQIASEIAVHIPGSAAGEEMRSSTFRGVQASGVSPRILSYKAEDKSGTAVVDKSKAKISRRSSTSVLSSIAPAALQAPSGRRLSLASDGMFHRSGFKGANLAVTVDGGKRTALQAALLVVANQHSVVAGGVVAEQAVDHLKTKAPSETVVYGKRKSGSRISFVLSDFEGIQPVGERATPWWMKDRSLFLFQPENKIRFCVTKMVEHEAYRWWEVMWCVWSVIVMVETNAHGDTSAKLHFLDDIDKVVFAVFQLDLVLKSVAYGFLLTREAYLEDPYNWLDVCNLICHCLYLKDHAFQDTQYFAKAALILMASRPFRLIPRFQNLRTLSTCIWRTIPAVGQVFLFTAVVYVIFALIGMQLFASKFRSCTDSSVKGHVDCVGMFRNEVGLLAPRTWINPPFHFDSFGDSMLALFVCSTFDSWLDNFLYTAMDITGIERSPRQNASPAYAIYFILFVSIAGFFILRMFLGVLIDQFGLMSGTKLLTERQKLWRDTNRLIQSLQPIRRPVVVTGWWIRRLSHKIVYNRAFELTVVVFVSINFLYYGAVVVNASGRVSIPLPIIFDLENFFITTTIVESLLKLLGTELSDWWYDKWNFLELYIAVSTGVCRFMKQNTITSLMSLFFLSVKVFRIVRYLNGLRTALVTVAVSLPSMLDITSLLGIFLFALAQVGTQVFYYIKDGICIRNGGENSFETWLTTFIMLLQSILIPIRETQWMSRTEFFVRAGGFSSITTLDNWSCLLIDITRTQPYCEPGVSAYASDCGFPVWGIVYMIFCICCTTYIFGNLFVAKVLDSITFGLLSEHALVTPAHLEAYRILWAKDEFDRKCKGSIPHHKFKEFLIRLGHPLGGRRHGFIKWFSRIEYETFHFRCETGIPFRGLLETLVLYKITSRGLELPVRIEREKQIQGIYQAGAAMKIQGLIRGFLQRRRNKKDRLRETEENDETRVTRGSDDKKRYSENPDDPPEVAFDEDPALAELGIARPPHPMRIYRPTQVLSTTADVHSTSQEVDAESATRSYDGESLRPDKTGSALDESQAPSNEADTE